MNISPLKIPGINTLVVDYLTAFKKTASFYSGDFNKIESYKEIAEKRIKETCSSKQRLSEVLAAQNKRFGCGDKTHRNVDQLAGSKCLAVVTGQQTGLFAGPLYTIYKALTTVKLAHWLEGQLKIPVVPIFYLVSEDHDFDEVKWIKVVDNQNQIVTLNYEFWGNERMPVCDIFFDDRITDLVDRFEGLFPETEFRTEIFRDLRKFYLPGTSISHAFARWMARLCNRYGVIFFDASDPEIKLLVRSVFQRELSDGSPSNVQASATGSRLRIFGYHEQVKINPSRPNVFILENGRHSLEMHGQTIINMGTGKSLRIADLLEHPERLSPKVVLRPIVQDTLLPTVAYVGGPGEISYFAQLKQVYRAFGLSMPIIFPRAGFTLVESKIQKHLDRFDLQVNDFLNGFKPVFDQVMRKWLPPALTKQISKTRATIESEWKVLIDISRQIEPSLESMLNKKSTRIVQQLGDVETKLLAALKNRKQVVDSQLRATYQNLFPEDRLQERQLNIVAYLVKYGWPLIERIYDEIDLKSVDHKIVNL